MENQRYNLMENVIRDMFRKRTSLNVPENVIALLVDENTTEDTLYLEEKALVDYLLSNEQLINKINRVSKLL